MFLLGTLFTLWIISSVRVTAAKDMVVLWLANLNILVMWTVIALRCLQQRLWEAFRSLGIIIGSLCQATIRSCARKWYRFNNRSILSVQYHDLELSGITFSSLYGRRPSSPLLRIPAEIREIMIRMCVLHYDVLDCRPTILLRPRKQFRDAMALIRTCRQLYQEGYPTVFGCTLFHIWTRNPFYRQLKPAIWNEFTMIHLAAQFNSQFTSRIAASIRDLDHMSSLRDIYISIWDFVDFENNDNVVAGVFGPLRIRLKDLSLVQINIICPRATNNRAEKRLKALIVAATGIWPVGREFGILRTLQGPVTKWRAFIKLQGYETKRTVGFDEDLVAMPWGGEHV